MGCFCLVVEVGRTGRLMGSAVGFTDQFIPVDVDVMGVGWVSMQRHATVKAALSCDNCG